MDEDMMKKIQEVLMSDEEQQFFVPVLKSKEYEDVSSFKKQMKKMILKKKICELDVLEEFFRQITRINSEID